MRERHLISLLRVYVNAPHTKCLPPLCDTEIFTSLHSVYVRCVKDFAFFALKVHGERSISNKSEKQYFPSELLGGASIGS